MVVFRRTDDLEVVRQILTDPRVYPLIGDDFAPAREDFRAHSDPRIWYVLAVGAQSSGPNLGVFSFLPESAICWQVHVAMLPQYWGRRTLEAGRQILPWIWQNTTCRRVIASIPECNRRAIRFGSEEMRMHKYGINERSFLKGGHLWDQILMGASRPGSLTAR